MEKDKSSKNNFFNKANPNPVTKSPVANNLNPIKTNSTKPVISSKSNLVNNPAKKTPLFSQAKKSTLDSKNTLKTSQVQKVDLPDRERAEALYVYGLRFYKTDKTKALFHLLESLKINPGYMFAYYNIAVIYGELGERENAIKYYNEVLKIDPDNRNTLFNLSNEYLYSGNYDLSIEYLERINQKEPEAYDCIGNLCIIYMFYKKDYSKAIEYYQILHKAMPKEPEIPYNIALCYELNGDEDKATAGYTKVIENYPYHYQSLFNLGSIYNKTLRKHKAVKLFQRYLDIPDKPLKHYNNVQYAIRRMKEYKEEGLI